MYKPSVASSEMTMLRKIEFVKSEFGVSGPSCLTILSMPLNARKNAAICTFHIGRISAAATFRVIRGPYCHVYRDDAESDERQSVEPLRTLRPVAKCENVAHNQQAEVKVLQYDVDYIDALEVE